MCFLFLDQADKCLGLQHLQHIICCHLLALLFCFVFFARYLYQKFFSIVKLCCFNLRQVWFHHWSVLPCRFSNLLCGYILFELTYLQSNCLILFLIKCFTLCTEFLSLVNFKCIFHQYL